MKRSDEAADNPHQLHSSEDDIESSTSHLTVGHSNSTVLQSSAIHHSLHSSEDDIESSTSHHTVGPSNSILQSSAIHHSLHSSEDDIESSTSHHTVGPSNSILQSSDPPGFRPRWENESGTRTISRNELLALRMNLDRANELVGVCERRAREVVESGCPQQICERAFYGLREAQAAQRIAESAYEEFLPRFLTPLDVEEYFSRD